MGKKVIAAKDIGRRLTGLSGFGFGANWEYPPSERDAVRRLITFLEDRRVLYAPTQVEIEYDVFGAVQMIREQCTTAISELSETAKSAPHVRAIRTACRKYLDTKNQSYPNVAALNPGAGAAAGWLIALGDFRTTVGMHLAILAAALNIDIEQDLKSILPAEDLPE